MARGDRDGNRSRGFIVSGTGVTGVLESAWVLGSCWGDDIGSGGGGEEGVEGPCGVDRGGVIAVAGSCWEGGLVCVGGGGRDGNLSPLP